MNDVCEISPGTPLRPDLTETLASIDMLQVARDQLKTAQSIRDAEDRDVDPSALLDVTDDSRRTSFICVFIYPSIHPYLHFSNFFPFFFSSVTGPGVHLSQGSDAARVTHLREDNFRRRVLEESMGTWHHINYQLSAREGGVRRYEVITISLFVSFFFFL